MVYKKATIENVYNEKNEKSFVEVKDDVCNFSVYCENYVIKKCDDVLSFDYHIILYDDENKLIGFCHVNDYEEKDIHLF